MIETIDANGSLGYHLGPNSQWLVNAGDRVVKGMPIARGERWQHAAASGLVTHAAATLVIEVQADAVEQRMPAFDPSTVSPADFIERVQEAGIAGLGGAGYPTHLKILAAIRHQAHTVVINAVECEDGIACDSALVREHASELLPALAALHRLPGIRQVTIACSSRTRPEIAGAFDVRELPGTQPADGEEHRLLRRLFGVDIPRKERPSSFGYLVINIGTLHAISEALAGKPLIRRLVTLPGAVRWAPLGLPVASLVTTPLYRAGGPLSGDVRSTAQAFVDKTSNAISGFVAKNASACIRCGYCDDVCPERLPVAQLLAHACAGHPDRLAALRLDDCIECGLCGPVCPSDIDVLASLRLGLRTLHTERQRTLEAASALARSSQRATRLAEQDRAQSEKRAARLSRLHGEQGDG